MPERNLVSAQCALLSILLCGIALLTGCTKFGNGNYEYDRLVDRTKDLGWDLDLDSIEERAAQKNRVEELESAASFLEKSTDTAEDDVARIVSVSEEARGIESEPIKLVASPLSTNPNGSTSQSKETNAATSAICEHGFECDCHKKREPLKLAHVEPIEPPMGNATQELIEAASSEIVSNATPPKGVISQPLTPLAPIESSTVASSDDASNELRSSEGFKLPPIPSDVKMPCCGEAICGANCPRLNDLRPNVPSEPVVTEPVVTEPVVIVSTVAPDEVPPFAEAPENSDEAFVVQDPQPEYESTEVLNTEPLAVQTEDNGLTEDEWVQLFQVDTAKPCVGCQSQQCTDANCTGERMNFEPIQGGGNFEASVASTSFQAPAESANLATGMKVMVTEEPSDSNQFAAASFTVDVPKFEIEKTVSDQAQAEPMTTPPPANVFVEEEFDASEVTAIDLSHANIEKAAQSLLSDSYNVKEMAPVEATQPEVTPEPQVQDQPQVKVVHEVEVIDNTIPWDVQLEDTISKVRSDMVAEMDPNRKNGLEVNLRLLQVLQRQMLSVEEHRQNLTDQQKFYWQHQLDAINAMLDSHANDQSDLARHSAALKTLDHLRKAVEELESIANLQLNNPAFCRQITGFGQFTPFESSIFKSDQKMLVYCEVENFLSLEKNNSFSSRYHTTLQGSYAIYDEQGRVVQQAEYPVVEDVVRKRRRDFYMYFPVQLKNLATGSYRLELLVEDLQGNKTASMPAMDFMVR